MRVMLPVEAWCAADLLAYTDDSSGGIKVSQVLFANMEYYFLRDRVWA